VLRSQPISLQARRSLNPCSAVSRPTARRRAAGVSRFSQQILQRRVVQHSLSEQLLQPPVLLLQRFRAHLRHLHSRLLLAQDPDDLLLANRLRRISVSS
jgi:hypothetical protein